MVDWDGEPSTQSIVVDTTARKLAEIERERLQTQLFEAQKMEAIGTLAGGIAHDFNNILGIILGFAELTLLEVTADSVVHSRVLKILNAGQRARDLVRHSPCICPPSSRKRSRCCAPHCPRPSTSVRRSRRPSAPSSPIRPKCIRC